MVGGSALPATRMTFRVPMRWKAVPIMLPTTLIPRSEENVCRMTVIRACGQPKKTPSGVEVHSAAICATIKNPLSASTVARVRFHVQMHVDGVLRRWTTNIVRYVHASIQLFPTLIHLRRVKLSTKDNYVSKTPSSRQFIFKRVYGSIPDSILSYSYRWVFSTGFPGCWMLCFR